MSGRRIKIIVTVLLLLVIPMCFVSCTDKGDDSGEKGIRVDYEPCGGSAVAAVTVQKGEKVSSPVSTRGGFVLEGWFTDKDYTTQWIFSRDAFQSDITLYAKWSPLKLEVTVSADNGTVTGEGTYNFGDEVTVSVKPEIGYVFKGWYVGDEKVSEEKSYTFALNAPVSLLAEISECDSHTPRNVDYVCTACLATVHKFVDKDNKCLCANCEKTVHSISRTSTSCYCKRCEKYDHSLDDECDCSICGEKDLHVFGSEKCFCTRCKKYAHDLDENNTCNICQKIIAGSVGGCDNGEHTFVGANCVCAKCGVIEHIADSSCRCTRCGKTGVHGYSSKGYCKHNGVYYFGYYPQSEVKDKNLINALNEKIGYYESKANSSKSFPSVKDKKKWTEDFYCENEKAIHNVWYIDKVHEGEKYRAVFSSSVDIIRNDDYGYNVNSVYWFKFEPVEWTLVGGTDKEPYLMSSVVLDAQNYSNDVKNDYKTSRIRSFLTKNFLKTAFTYKQRGKLISIPISEKSEETEKIEDKITLLSLEEIKSYEREKRKETTAYCRYRGLWKNSYGFTNWWLRTPSGDNFAYYVLADGLTDSARTVNGAHFGVVPVIWLKD